MIFPNKGGGSRGKMGSQFYLQIFDIQSKYTMYSDCLQIKGLRLPSISTTVVSLTKYDPPVQYITY